MVFAVMVLWGQTFKGRKIGHFNLKPMLKMALPMLLVSGTGVIASNSDVIMIGILGTLKDVGIYSVAAKLAIANLFVFAGHQCSYCPKISKLV